MIEKVRTVRGLDAKNEVPGRIFGAPERLLRA